MVATKPLLAACLALLPWTEAAQIFYNAGKKGGWDGFTHENKGTVNEDSEVFFKGDSSLHMFQQFTENYDGRYHSEAYHNDGYKRGDDRYYGFAFQLDKDWSFAGSESYNLAQFISNRDAVSDNCGDDWMPSTMFWLTGNNLHTRLVYGDYSNGKCNRQFRGFDNILKVTAGVWHTVIIHGKWESDKTGVFQMWYDGKLIVDESNLATTISEDSSFSFRVGLYANGWHDKGNVNDSGQNQRNVWYDEVAIGDSKEDVDPNGDGSSCLHPHDYSQGYSSSHSHLHSQGWHSR
ncbi:polysaccharide lyase-domain-containing protein [Mariannaea sp. PMI_226]|nr:polysaccharide lyase-domain-containing protein [Mariannaea sp. PMI_226]